MTFDPVTIMYGFLFVISGDHSIILQAHLAQK